MPIIDGFNAARFLVEFARYPTEVARAYQEKHGPAILLRPSPLQGAKGRSFFVTANRDVANHVLNNTAKFRTVGIALTRGPKNSAQRRLRNGMVRMNGPEQMALRRAYAPSLSNKKLKLQRHKLQQICERELLKWPKAEVFDAHSGSIELAHKVSADLLFGIPDDPLIADLGEKICGQLLMQYSLRTYLFPLNLPGTPYSRLLKHAEEIEADLLEWLQNRSCERDSLTACIAELNEIDALDRAAQLWTLYAASFETTATALRWTLLHLAWNPETQEALFADVQTHGHQSSYLDAVLLESLRLSTPGPFQLRRLHETVELAGVVLQRKDHVAINAAAINRDREFFDAPHAFRPERWHRSSQSPMSPLAFSAGPRRCLGAHFAMLVLRTFLASLFGKYKIDVPDNAKIDTKLANTHGPSSLPIRLISGTSKARASRFTGRARDQMSGQ